MKRISDAVMIIVCYLSSKATPISKKPEQLEQRNGFQKRCSENNCCLSQDAQKWLNLSDYIGAGRKGLSVHANAL